jgi:hypothetical protein
MPAILFGSVGAVIRSACVGAAIWSGSVGSPQGWTSCPPPHYDIADVSHEFGDIGHSPCICYPAEGMRQGLVISVYSKWPPIQHVPEMLGSGRACQKLLDTGYCRWLSPASWNRNRADARPLHPRSAAVGPLRNGILRCQPSGPSLPLGFGGPSRRPLPRAPWCL